MDLSGATTPALLLLCLSCLVLYLNGKSGSRKSGKMPPGPAPLPFVGNLFQLDPKEMHRSLEKLSESYGPIYTIHLGSLPCVVLCGYQAVKEALVDQADDFSGRGDFPVFYRFTRGNGIAFSNGEKWKVLRRFALQTLKNFGMGTSSIEGRIQEEAQFLVQEFKKTGGAPFNPINPVCRAVSNVICAVVFGQRYDYQDANFLTLLDHFNENFKIMSSIWGELYNIFPSLMDVLPGPHHQIFRNFEKLRQFIAERIRCHQKDLDPDAPRDFIDCFLIRMEQEKQDPLSYFHTETLVMTTHNLFFGGTETTSTTLRYSFLILMKHPEVAARVHQEIDHVIGPDRPPCLDDRKHMPYTEAVLYEIQRYISILPMGLPRAVTRDTPFRGFLLPKGTNVIPLLSSVHYDPTRFKDPTGFNPANFLDENGAFKSSDAFMPFAPGKRICLGAGLARMEIFLFLTTILQHFSLHPTVPPAKIDLTPQCTGLGNVPRPFEFRLLPR
ncbi:cytochrome P450 2F3-like [Podarcis lilfordi]|uniref:Cytochrome P450 2F3-like n=1 Tax=Podarcis lilfordi TaxID=74358 RepID=A0AA35PCY3_9SAUR|nr:cytochrome P450 2F3-like [Podarcis lilfordi]